MVFQLVILLHQLDHLSVGFLGRISPVQQDRENVYGYHLIICEDIMEHPVKVSVVMPTYNTAVPVLKAAVDSILNQSFRDFEFIIVDDHSTDGSEAYLSSLSDPRIRLLRNMEQLGVTKSLNVGLRAAKGRYIARMDSDDISLPERFEKQVAFMESHPDAIACGTGYENIGASSGVCLPIPGHLIPQLFWIERSFLSIMFCTMKACPMPRTTGFGRIFVDTGTSTRCLTCFCNADHMIGKCPDNIGKGRFSATKRHKGNCWRSY